MNLYKFVLKKILFIALLLSLHTTICIANDNKSMLLVKEGLGKGDVDIIASVFDKTIDITFSNDKTTTYSKAQAAAILKKFFAKTAIQDFKLQHRGKSTTNNTMYGIGTLYATNADYKVYMFFVPNGTDYLLRELRFEKL